MLITYVTLGQILARIVFKPLELMVFPICAERPLKRLLISFTAKHCKLDVPITYVTPVQILASILFKPVAQIVISIVLTTRRIGTPTTH